MKIIKAVNSYDVNLLKKFILYINIWDYLWIIFIIDDYNYMNNNNEIDIKN